MRTLRTRAIVLVCVCMASSGLVAGCGSSGKTSASSTSATSASTGSGGTSSASGSSSKVSAAAAAVKEALPIPSGISITTSLKSKPPHETVGWLEPSIAAGTLETPAFESGTKALGWTLKTIPMNPLQPGAAMRQAINEHVNFIDIIGESAALYAPELKAAQKAGIPVLSCYDDTTPTGTNSGSGPYAQCGGLTTAAKGGKLLADWAVASSDGKANVVVFNVNTYPNLVYQAAQFKQELAAKCPSCAFDSENVTLAQMTQGQIPQVVTSFIQANPKYNYIYFTFSDPPTGVAAALKTAGLLKGRKIFGLDFNPQRLGGIIDGQEAAWTGLPKQYSAWLQLDTMARLAEHMSIAPDQQAQTLPQILVDTVARAKQYVKAGSWSGPTNYEQDFEKLWHVG